MFSATLMIQRRVEHLCDRGQIHFGDDPKLKLTGSAADYKVH
jgi:hypothetical protein